MRRMRWFALLSTALLVIACFLPWVYIDSRQFTATGVDAGAVLHKPGYTHFVFAAVYVALVLIPQIWAKRINLAIAALNIAWATRNFLVVTACTGGECPEKKAGIYLILLASVCMLLASFFPDITIRQDEENKR